MHLVINNRLEDVGVVMNIHARIIRINLGVRDDDLLDDWEDSKLLHGKIEFNFNVHLEGEEGGISLVVAFVGNHVEFEEDAVLFSDDETSVCGHFEGEHVGGFDGIDSKYKIHVHATFLMELWEYLADLI